MLSHGIGLPEGLRTAQGVPNTNNDCSCNFFFYTYSCSIQGYVQLTWWSNYAQAGIAIGRGLDLLLDPELVKTPAIAYALMSHGMRTGKGFANGRRFTNYFTTVHTDYAGARQMVNGHDHAADIAALALRFESVLLKARVAPSSSSAVLP